MSRLGDQKVYALTARDVTRINDLLAVVKEAVGELLEYRCIRPLDPDSDFPREGMTHEQANALLRDLQPRLDEIF